MAGNENKEEIEIGDEMENVNTDAKSKGVKSDFGEKLGDTNNSGSKEQPIKNTQKEKVGDPLATSVGELSQKWLLYAIDELQRELSQGANKVPATTVDFKIPDDIETYTRKISAWMQNTPAIHDEFFGEVLEEGKKVGQESPPAGPAQSSAGSTTATQPSPTPPPTTNEEVDEIVDRVFSKVADQAGATSETTAPAASGDEATHALEGEVLPPEEDPEENESDMRDALREALMAAFAERGASGPAARSSASADGIFIPETFVGGYEEIALQGMMLLKRYPGNAALALRVATGPLADALERLHFEGHSPEQQVDILVHLFAGEKVYAGGGSDPTCNEGFLAFMARLRALMRTQPEEERGRGYLESLTNLVTWYGRSHSRTCLACAVDLGLEVLQAALQPERIEGENVERYVYLLANNLAGWLDDLLPNKGDDDLKRGDRGRDLNAIHAVATVAHLRREKGGRQDQETRAQAVFAAFSLTLPERSNPYRLAQALIFMARIQPAWRLLCPAFAGTHDLFRPMSPKEHAKDAGLNHPRYLTAVLAAMAAAQRAALMDQSDSDEAVSGLFNLGVDMLSHARSSGNREGVTPLRILSNGLGLWWALLRGKDINQALTEFHGGDCAVNFFGALTDTSRSRDGDIEDALSRLGRALHALLQQRGQHTDAMRLGRSYQEIFGVEVGAATTTTLAQLQEDLLAVLRYCLAGALKLPDAPEMKAALDETRFPETLARWLDAAFEAEARIAALAQLKAKKAAELALEEERLRKFEAAAIQADQALSGLLEKVRGEPESPRGATATSDKAPAGKAAPEEAAEQDSSEASRVTAQATPANSQSGEQDLAAALKEAVEAVEEITRIAGAESGLKQYFESLKSFDMGNPSMNDRIQSLHSELAKSIASERIKLADKLSKIQNTLDEVSKLQNDPDDSQPGEPEQQRIDAAIANYRRVRSGWLEVARQLANSADRSEGAYNAYKDQILYKLSDWGVKLACSHPPEKQPPVTGPYLADLLRSEKVMRQVFNLQTR